jgi:hypothetical protein
MINPGFLDRERGGGASPEILMLLINRPMTFFLQRDQEIAKPNLVPFWYEPAVVKIIRQFAPLREGGGIRRCYLGEMKRGKRKGVKCKGKREKVNS